MGQAERKGSISSYQTTQEPSHTYAEELLESETTAFFFVIVLKPTSPRFSHRMEIALLITPARGISLLMQTHVTVTNFTPAQDRRFFSNHNWAA